MTVKQAGCLLICYLIISPVQAGSVEQKTKGWCSPAVNDTKGNITIDCHGVSPKIVKRLEELLDKNELDLIKAKETILLWFKKYNELKSQLTARPAADKKATKAKILLENGDLKGAKDLLKQSLVQNLEKRSHLAKEKKSLDQATAKDAYNLGLLEELQLDYVAARSYFEQAASIAPDNTLYLNQAGLINLTLAKYKKAIEYLEQALSNNLKTFGKDHPEVAIVRNNLGSAWQPLGEHQKAIEYLELALSSDLKTYG